MDTRVPSAAAHALPPEPPAGVPLRLPVHPGRFLERQFLQPLGISQTRAAALLGVSRRRVNELVMGHRAMSPDTALRCAIAFGTTVTFWLHLQVQWDAWQAWRALRGQVRAGQPLPPVVVAGASGPSQAAARRLRRRAAAAPHTAA
ncbi:HigA family addiction module antitoxin [Ideonella livida]|uniref:HigA family addiction module antidote protein n=1 Tax=Ideonella livida TaxID=2707176 RepID=A0A7C9PF33_9BURK|nr:HigA family addiction module antitoxin [Ideonella livida]NDY89812.1 HigA family addiction module antidote protein [Ideonella livida]